MTETRATTPFGLTPALTAGQASAGGLPPPASYNAAYLSDHAQIVDVITSVTFYADQRRWELVKAAFADKVVIDYTSSDTAAAGAAKAETMTPEQIATAWQSQLPGYLHTQHLLTGSIVTIDGDHGLVTSSIYATHFLPNDKGDAYWVFVGDYRQELARTPAGWRITKMQANKRFELGNKDLPAMASARVKVGQIATTP
jgi:hypothetical protein